MRLLIVSHTEHYRRDGEVVGHGATLREIDHLATLFDEVVHVACLHEGEAPASALPYRAPNVHLRGVPPAGGASLRDKARILRLYPHYARIIWDELGRADAVHVRCPANLSLLAIVLLALRRHPRKCWIKYAGNWQPYDGEARSYRFQRWWLRKGLSRGAVTVNGAWPDQPAHVHAFLNPCLTEAELEEGATVARAKSLREPVRLLYVGRIEREKGVERAMEVLAQLKERGVRATLSLIGEGPQRPDLERAAGALGVEDAVTFHGGLPREALAPHYARAHFFLMPTICSEGWPKVLSEAMAYGVVPLASRVSSIPQHLERFGTGRALDPRDVSAYADAVCAYLARPEAWRVAAARGVAAARAFGYTTYLSAVARLFRAPEVSAHDVQLWPTEAVGPA